MTSNKRRIIRIKDHAGNSRYVTMGGSGKYIRACVQAVDRVQIGKPTEKPGQLIFVQPIQKPGGFYKFSCNSRPIPEGGLP